VQERSANVQVAFASGREQKRSSTVNENTDCCYDDHGFASDFTRIAKSPNGFPRNAANSDHQQNRIGERCENRRAAESISPAGSWPRPAEVNGAPCEQKSQYIAEIVAGISD